MRPILPLLLVLPALAAELPAPPPAAALTPGPLHSTTNLAPAEARAALASALPSPSTNAVAALLAPDGRAQPIPFGTSGWWVDAVALPIGLFETATPATMSTPSRALLCDPEHVRAVVWRYRRGTAPREVPMDLEHASEGGGYYLSMGRVVGAYFDEARGAVFRVELTAAGKAAVETGRLRLSPELVVLTATTTVNAAIGVEGEDSVSIPWALRSLALTADPALPTPRLSAADLRPLSEISVYPRGR